MVESLRERKKRQTRRLLADTAIRLFDEQGYDQTTVAQIASTADVATKTFFNYFPSKEDVMFPDVGDRRDIAMDVITHRQPDESLSDLLVRLCERVFAFVASNEAPVDPSLLANRTRLILTVPALQARFVHLVFDLQRQVAEALQKAYPERLDPVSSAAVVGCVVGAAQGAALASLERGTASDQVWDSTRYGIEIAMNGIRSLG